ncbi:DsbA family protein [Acidimangrovimonas pyrenivorans]|uniref:DsbA family protein n=1 Tax=Acidimangrovimonas pyrenivorans TaxID=2030798 RepID=A0ABV7AD82_9RHOB
MFDRRDVLKLGLGLGTVLLLPTAVLAEQPDFARKIEFDPDAPVLGNPKGDVSVIEYFDYQCPYCKANHPMVSRVVAEDGNIRYVMKDWPIFGPASVRASALALGSVALGKYPQVNAALMKTRSPLNTAMIDAALRSAGVDPAQAKASFDREGDKWRALLGRNDTQARGLGLPGTPGYVVGRDVFPGVIHEPALRDAVARARG